ncbi:hypothetical protein [Streptomyces sp. NPDC046862]
MTPRALVRRALRSLARALRHRPHPADPDAPDPDTPAPDAWLAGIRLRG